MRMTAKWCILRFTINVDGSDLIFWGLIEKRVINLCWSCNWLQIRDFLHNVDSISKHEKESDESRQTVPKDKCK